MESQQRIVIRPIPEVFQNYVPEQLNKVETSNVNPALEKLLPQGAKLYLTEKVVYPESGGMHMKYKDVEFYRQGFVFPEAMDCISSVKKITTLFLAVLKGKGIKGRIGTFLAHYVWIADWMFQWYDPNTKQNLQIYLKDNRYRQSVQELIKFINNFLDFVGIEVTSISTGHKDFGRVIGTLIEYDNAYYWRMEDIFSVVNKENLLKNPRKEIKRIVKIYQQREKGGIEFKVEMIGKTLNWLLFIPSVKKAFKQAINSIDFEKLKMTHGLVGEVNDSYFTMNYEGYEFEGKSLKERQKIWLEMTGGIPPQRFIIPTK